MIPALQPLPLPSVSRTHACAALDIGDRRLRDLIRAGRLVTVGAGHARRITGESLRDEIEAREKRKAEMFETKSGNRVERVPEFGFTHLDGAEVLPHSESGMVLRLPNNRELELPVLLPIARAAALLGLSDRVLRRAVDAGELPVVTIGSRQRINTEVLRTWAKGRPMERL